MFLMIRCSGEFAKLRATRAIRASVVYVPTSQHGDVPKARQFLIFTCQRSNNRANMPTCQRRTNYSTWRANFPTYQRHANFSIWRVNAFNFA